VKEVVVDSAADAPLPISVGVTEIAGATRAGLTVTVTGAEGTVARALSVTSSSKLQTPGVDRVPVEVVGREEVLQLKELPREL
jgi:hypothetical protein